MKYSIKEITISQLIDWIKKDKVNLHPPYQRNFIWSSKDQKLLIDSIMKGYPLPNFFIYKKKDDTYDMVDGQQRATTISKYVKGDFADSGKNFYQDIDQQTSEQSPRKIYANPNCAEDICEFDMDTLLRRDVTALLRVYTKITDPKIQRNILDLITALAGENTTDSDRA